MLTLLGPRHRYCDGISRRSFLRIGGLAACGLGLPQILKAETKPGASGSQSRSSWCTCRAGCRIRTRSTSSPMRPPRSAASSSRSPATCRASRSASCCPLIAAIDGQDRRRAVDRRPPRRAFELAEPDRLPDVAEPARGPAAFRLGRLAGAGAGRPGRAAVRRPLPDDAAQALQRRERGQPRLGLPRGQGERRRPRPPEADRRLRRPIRATAGACSASSTASAGLVDSAEVDGDGRRSIGVPSTCSRPSKVANALDVEREDPRLRDRYGTGLGHGTSATAPRCGTTSSWSARRLVEAGARVRDGRVRVLGHPRRQLPPPQRAPAAVRPGHLGPGRGHPRPGLARRRDGRRLGRVRPDAEDQQGRRPRPLGTRQSALFCRRRDEGRPGHRLDRQAWAPMPPRRRSTITTSWPPSTRLGIDPHEFLLDKTNRPMSPLPSTAAADRGTGLMNRQDAKVRRGEDK